jgi:hypothetical protein
MRPYIASIFERIFELLITGLNPKLYATIHSTRSKNNCCWISGIVCNTPIQLNEVELTVKLGIKYHFHTYPAADDRFFKPSFLTSEIYLLSQNGSSLFDIEAGSSKLSLQKNSSKTFLDSIFGLKEMFDLLSALIENPSFVHQKHVFASIGFSLVATNASGAIT